MCKIAVTTVSTSQGCDRLSIFIMTMWHIRVHSVGTVWVHERIGLRPFISVST